MSQNTIYLSVCICHKYISTISSHTLYRIRIHINTKNSYSSWAYVISETNYVSDVYVFFCVWICVDFLDGHLSFFHHFYFVVVLKDAYMHGEIYLTIYKQYKFWRDIIYFLYIFGSYIITRFAWIFGIYVQNLYN